jgi:isopenicillin N synthase-like dioxygenase
MALDLLPAASRIPIVDLGGTQNDPERRAAAAREIERAATDTGFFYVANHGVDPTLTDAVFTAARTFFALPDERKRSILMGRGKMRGYEPLESETLDPLTGHDLKESFRLAREDSGVPNLWPADLPGFRAALLSYYAAASTLGARLVRLLALSLGETETVFDAAYRGTNPTMRLLHYPPRPSGAAERQIGAGAHTDWGGLTILAQDDVGGLEVCDASGQWLRATPVPGTFVINLGDLIARWTNDRYHSNPHRVFNPPDAHDRYSVVMFYGPRDDARIACLPTCRRPGEAPRYAPCTAGEHLSERWRAAYGLTDARTTLDAFH